MGKTVNERALGNHYCIAVERVNVRTGLLAQLIFKYSSYLNLHAEETFGALKMTV